MSKNWDLVGDEKEFKKLSSSKRIGKKRSADLYDRAVIRNKKVRIVKH